MAGDIAVEFNNVAKYFKLVRGRPRSFQEAVVRFFKRAERDEEFWVLKDISFTLGAGKSGWLYWKKWRWEKYRAKAHFTHNRAYNR